MTPEQVAAAITPTPRQLTFWVTKGWLRPGGGGKGNPWTWPTEEWAVACLMARLAAAGIHHGVAADIARVAVEKDNGLVKIAPGLILVIKMGEGP